MPRALALAAANSSSLRMPWLWRLARFWSSAICGSTAGAAGAAGSGRGRVGLLLQGGVLGLEIGQLLVLVVLVGRILGGCLAGMVGGRADRRYTDKPDTASSSHHDRFPFPISISWMTRR